MKKQKLTIKSTKTRRAATPPDIKVNRAHDEMFDMDEHELAEVMLTHPKQMTVTLEYDPTRLDGTSLLLMESIAARGVIPADYGTAHAIKMYQIHSRTSAGVLAGDHDRWYQFTFAAEWLRVYASREEWREASVHGRAVNPDWDASGFDEKQDGSILGSVEDYFDEIDVMIPIKEQVAATQAQEIATAAPTMGAAPQAQRPDQQEAIWGIAIEKARGPRESWENKVDWMLEQKIKYCYNWLQETGEMTVPYPRDTMAIFWPVPTKHLTDTSQTLVRRDKIVGMVLDFWRAAVAKNPTGVNLKSTSYRVTLGAMRLSSAIDAYVSAGARQNMVGNDLVTNDAKELQAVQIAAKEYFGAHVPAELMGGKPGPLNTLDPNYLEYIGICRQFGFPLGTILHEQNL